MKFEDLYGKKIYKASFEDNSLILGIDGVGKVRIFDGGQSCCEHRYATCDDNPESLVGGTLESVTTDYGSGTDEGEYGYHETAFVTVQSSKGFIKMTTHNVHNGYYGGFSVSVEGIS